MDQLVTQLGVGGIFAFLVIREVLTFLKAKQNGKIERNGRPDDMGMVGLISRDEFDKHKTQVRYKDVCDAKHEAIKDSLDRIESLIRNGHRK